MKCPHNNAVHWFIDLKAGVANDNENEDKDDIGKGAFMLAYFYISLLMNANSRWFH